MMWMPLNPSSMSCKEERDQYLGIPAYDFNYMSEHLVGDNEMRIESSYCKD